MSYVNECVWMRAGTERLWPILLLLNAFPALLCCIVLPFLPESPRYLMLVRKDASAAEKGRKISLPCVTALSALMDKCDLTMVLATWAMH